MDLKEFQSILTIGETVAVEFKRCGNGIESDTYETVCSFLNRFVCLFVCFFVKDRVSLSNPGYPGTHCRPSWPCILF